MATKQFKSLVNETPSHEITLDNIDGTVHAAGTRGMITKDIFNAGATRYGFQPLTSKGYLGTNPDLITYWIPGVINEVAEGVYEGIPSGCVVASNGDLLVFAYSDFDGSPAAQTDLRCHVFDGTDGTFVKTVVVHTSSNLYYTTGDLEDEAGMWIDEPLSNFFVVVVKDRNTNARYIVHGINYNTSTQTPENGSVGSSFTPASMNFRHNTALMASINNANDKYVIVFPDTSEHMEAYEYDITGTAGNYAISATKTTRFQGPMNTIDGYYLANCDNTQGFMHRLSNDDIVVFQHLESGAGTSVDYVTTGDYYINIFDANMAAITQQYYLQGEAPATTLTNKFYNHSTVFSFKIATDKFVVLTKCVATSSTTRGPDGWWSDGNGGHHIRATLVEIDPLDNSIISNSDLGEFHAELWNKHMMIGNDYSVENFGNRTFPMHYYHDATNECVYMFSGMGITRLDFTASYAATDGGDYVLCPFGPKTMAMTTADFTSTETLGGIVGGFDDGHETYCTRKVHGGTHAYDATNNRMWTIFPLTYASTMQCSAGWAMYDVGQQCGSNIEVVVSSADANTVTGFCAVETWPNNGEFTAGQSIISPHGDKFCVNSDYLISEVPTRHFYDILGPGRCWFDQTDIDALTYLHPDAMYFNFTTDGVIADDVPMLRQDFMDGGYYLNETDWFKDIDSVGFGEGYLNGSQAAGYHGAIWSSTTLDQLMVFYFIGLGGTVAYGNLTVVSEGHWIYGNWGYMTLQGSLAAADYRRGFHLGPSSDIRINGWIEDAPEVRWKYISPAEYKKGKFN